METKIQNNYDDFDRVILEGENDGSGLFSPFTFICVLLFLTLFGLLSLYSATFDLAVRNGFEHYYYLFNQAAGAVLGLVLGLAARLLPIKLIRRSYYFLSALTLFVLFLMLKPEFNINGVLYIKGMRIISPYVLSIFSSIMLISGTTQSISKLNERHGLFYGAVFIVLTLIAVLTSLTCGYGEYILLVMVIVSMLHASGAGKGYSLLALFFYLATGLFILFIKKDFLSELMYSVMPVLDPELYDHQLITSQMAIKDGGIWGIGIGHGLYKLGILDGVESSFIFSNLCEEIGIFGVLVIFLVVFAYVFLGIRASQRAMRKKSFSISGAAVGISMFILFSSLLNSLYASGIFPFTGILFPFFSYGPGEMALFMFISILQYRYIHLMGRPHEKA